MFSSTIGKTTKVGLTATAIRTRFDHIPYYLSGLLRAHFF